MVDLASVIRPGDGIVWGQACAEPQTLVEAFVAQRASYPGACVFMGSSFTGIVKPEHADHLRPGATEGAECVTWLAMRGALSARAKKIHQNYYLPMTSAMAVALFEEPA